MEFSHDESAESLEFVKHQSVEDGFRELTTGILEEQHVKILEERALKNAVRIKTMEPPWPVRG